MIQCDLSRELFEEKGPQISDAIHQGLIAGLDMPEDDLFQVFRPHGPGEIIFSPSYGGVDRRDMVLIRVTMVHMFSVATKQQMYREVVTRLEAIGVRHQDVLICVLEPGFEDWYAGSEL
jgi:hypothetical protein